MQLENVPFLTHRGNEKNYWEQLESGVPAWLLTSVGQHREVLIQQHL